MRPTLSFAPLALLLAACAGPAAMDGGDRPAAPSPASRLRFIGSLPPPPGAERFDPSVLAIDARGRILVADRARGAIFVYDRDGPPSSTLAEPPASGDGAAFRFQDVRSIVAGSGLYIYVLDAGAARVYSYDLANQLRGTELDLERSALLLRFGRVQPAALAIDPTGRPVVADRDGDRLLVFDPQWNPDHEIGGPGSTGGGFRDPSGLAFAPRGDLYVADRGNGLVQRFDPVGAYLSEYSFPHAPESVVVDAEGNLFVGDAAGFVTLVTGRGQRFDHPPRGAGAGPAYLALARDGRRLYVSRPGRGAVDILEVLPAGASP